jgi:hypothetical protein
MHRAGLSTPCFPETAVPRRVSPGPLCGLLVPMLVLLLVSCMSCNPGEALDDDDLANDDDSALTDDDDSALTDDDDSALTDDDDDSADEVVPPTFPGAAGPCVAPRTEPLMTSWTIDPELVALVGNEAAEALTWARSVASNRHWEQFIPELEATYAETRPASS